MAGWGWQAELPEWDWLAAWGWSDAQGWSASWGLAGRLKLACWLAGPGSLTGAGQLMTFSEVTDAFVEGSVKMEKDAWALAKSRKVAGDDVLYNTLGAARCVSSLVAKVRQAWNCELMSGGTLHTRPEYGLTHFIPWGSISSALVRWLRGEWSTKALLLQGEGGLGKTELACALVHAVSPTKAYHFVNKVDRLRDISFSPGEGLVVDEACLAMKDVDDAKALVDLKKSRDVTCRNKDGHLPCRTPRVFSTNWPWSQFWPREVFDDAHNLAISRRVLWVTVKTDLRKISLAEASPSSLDRVADADADEVVPFGWGGGMESAE